MNPKAMLAIGMTVGVLAGVGGWARAAQDKYTVRVQDGLLFSDFRGYEDWQLISVSQANGLISAILGNPIIIEAYRAGVPGNKQPFPDGARMAKIHWTPKPSESFPTAIGPGTQHDVDFMVKDSKKFADSGGWGYAAFKYDAKSDTFSPLTLDDHPPQGNDAKCGFACHTVVKSRDYVFTDYARR
ncbi:MAG: cytochrome P460 family protein [Haliea sp.]|nr:cytochrome P460 family protein [Haliea sp.]